MSTHKSENSAHEVGYIPPDSSERHRTLVLCFDGTGNKIDSNHTNVSQFFSMLRKDDCNQQMVYYQTGIGTYTRHKFGPITSVIAETLDSMFGGGIQDHIKDGYEFLMQNYRADDRICLFGFSRGAYTARALAAMIHKVGLLPPSNIKHIEYAFKAFLKCKKKWEAATEFKKCFCMDVKIHFVGIWDSVGSIGVGIPPIPFDSKNTTIKYFRHALSLDERRCRFKANVWMQYEVDSKEDSPGHTRTDRRKATGAIKDELINGIEHSTKEHKHHPTDIKEVWFSGCHSDVGGGAVPHKTRHTLARISLRWMIRECFLSKTEIMFTTDSVRDLGMDTNRLYPNVLSRPPASPVGNLKIKRPTRSWEKDRTESGLERRQVSEEDEELHDALAPSYDELKLRPFWWLLELFPTINRDEKTISVLKANLGGPRTIGSQKLGVNLHRSVKIREGAQYEPKRSSGTRAQEEPYYSPKPRIEVEPTWVEEPRIEVEPTWVEEPRSTFDPSKEKE